MKKIIIAMALVLVLSASAFAGSFADVPNNHWAYEAVNKLVAMGLIQGYPDGTFKGQNDVSRYEMAVIVARLLDDIEEARAELVDQVDFMVKDAMIDAKSGLSKQQAEQVQAILQKVMENNQQPVVEDKEVVVPVPQELSAGQAGEVMGMIGDLAYNLKSELKDLGVKVDGLDSRVAALEVVTFSGEYKAEFNYKDYEGTAYDNPFNAGDALGNDLDVDVNSDDDADYFKHSLDLNVAVNKVPVKVDMNLKASVEGLGIAGYDSGDELNLDSLSAVLTGPEFKATIKEGQDESIREYLFKKWTDGDNDDTDVYLTNGVKLETMGETYLLSGYEVYNTTNGEFDGADGFAFGATNTLETLGGINFVYGFQTLLDSLVEDNNNVFGLYKTYELGDFDVTPELAISNTDFDELYFKLNAVGNIGQVKTTFNYKNIKDEFTPVYAKDIDATDGFDIKGETSFGIVDTVGFHENYGNPFTYVEGEVTEANGVDVAGYNVFGNAAFRTYSDVNDATSSLLTVQAKNSYGNLDVLGKFEYQQTSYNFDVEDGGYDNDDDSNYEEETDKTDLVADLGYTFSDSLTGGAFYRLDLEHDNGITEHVYNIDYKEGIYTAGAELKLVADETHVYAGLNADKAKSYDMFAVALTPYAQYKYWNTDAAYSNILAGVDASKELSEYATVTAGYEVADYEYDDDFGDDTFNAGTLLTAKLGASYKITEDVTANADYKNMNFNGDSIADYQVDELSASVSVAF